jgi:hypothetical protein
VARFRVDSAHEVLKDPGGHRHHWTVLAGALLDGELRIGDALSIPRVGGSAWLGHVIGFEAFRLTLGDRIDPALVGNRTIGVFVWGLAPPADAVATGEAHTVEDAVARQLARDLARTDPERVRHCPDCARLTHRT